MAEHTEMQGRVKIEQIVGENVNRLRKRRGWTQTELGQEVGKVTGKPWARSVVSMAEAGDRAFAVADLVTLCYVFEVAPEALLVMTPEVNAVQVGQAVLQRWQLAPISYQAAPTRRGYEYVMQEADQLHDELEDMFRLAVETQKRGDRMRSALLRLRSQSSFEALGVARAEDYEFDRYPEQPANGDSDE